jgi:hypothetical protein
VNVVIEKLQIQEVNKQRKSYNRNGVPIVGKEGIGEFYLVMKLYGIDKIYFFMFDFISKHRQA